MKFRRYKIRRRMYQSRNFFFFLIVFLNILLLLLLKVMPQENKIKGIETVKPIVKPTQQPTVAPKPTEIPQVVLIPTSTPTPVITQPSAVVNTMQGYVSHYSRAGCLGCSPNMTMANGQPLNDNAFTIAVHPKTLAMGTKVRLTNLDNGNSVIVEVTDTGGFAKYNRIADLTLAVQQALQTKTDSSIVKMEILSFN